ncbi:hypothetical protein [Methylocystis heyeri]|uniref:Uncharacterized protein n=1 Tax=Methylocystis heyeri TaxID=391905 RepID=A0A6B8KFW4_9HYPH|nr:hypothetical protein [Methylocystis heyeri]QGM45891.1 hypothetical protein H2LOC_009355 [Methylocystis heyeri]
MDEKLIEELTAKFSGLPAPNKTRFIARVAHWETIHARVAYHEYDAKAEALHKSLEYLHRLCGYLMHVPTQDERNLERDRWFMQMILQRGGLRGAREIERIRTLLQEEALAAIDG